MFGSHQSTPTLRFALFSTLVLTLALTLIAPLVDSAPIHTSSLPR